MKFISIMESILWSKPWNWVEDNVIYDPDQINLKRLTHNYCRYPLTIKPEIYEPLNLDLNLYLKLFDKIKILNYDIDNSINISSKIDLNVVEYVDGDSLVTFIPSHIDHLIITDSEDNKYLTALGLYALRLKNFFKNLEFKKYIQNEFLSKYFHLINIYENYYWIEKEFYKSTELNALLDLYSNKSKIIKLDDSNLNLFQLSISKIFSWR